jgi:dimethylglycine catabolism A
MKLLEALDVGPVTLPNRLAVPAMVTRLSGEDGRVNDDVVDRYARYAEGNVGLIVVEASSVHGGKSGPLLRVSDDEFIPGLRQLTSACHAASDSKVFLQIIHFLKIARSGWREKVSEVDAERLEELPELFAAAALRAQEAGFDGVELHMAHAYTLSSLLSRHNRRSDKYGRTLENRLRVPSMVLRTVRAKVDQSFGVAVRFDADESIRRGYSVIEAGQMAVRFAELGAGYVSLSAGGKFEDAVYRDGKPLYPYTGYSGDRCMPGDTYIDGANSWMAEAVKGTLRAHGHDTPVLATGKIGSAQLAEDLLQGGVCDIVGMARALLADPYLLKKFREGHEDETVRCIYCNVCKSLDENFNTVVCYLWPKDAIQAPRPDEQRQEPIRWPADIEPLTATAEAGQIRLKWTRPEGPAVGFDVLRSEDLGPYERLTSCTRASQLDDSVLSGRSYRYRVVPYSEDGRRGEPSNILEIELDPGDADEAMALEDADVSPQAS